MKKNFFLLALCMTWALVTNVQAAFVPTPGVLYNIIQTDGKVIGGTGTQPQVVTLAAETATQAFQFIPVIGATDTYYIQNAAGNYLNKVASSGWNVVYAATTDGTNSQWILEGTDETLIRLRMKAISGNSNYLDAQGGTNLYDNNALRDQGKFALSIASITAVTVKYQDVTGNNLKGARVALGLTDGAIYTATEADKSTFVDALGITYSYDASSSTDNATVVAGVNTPIILKFLPQASIATSVASVKFNVPLSQTFTVSGVNLGSPIVFSAPEGSGITFSPTEVPADASNVLVTVTASSVVTAGDITLTSGSTTKTIAYSFGPSVGAWFSITQLSSNLAFGGSTPTQPAVMTPTTNAANQLFTFIPVTGKADTYNIKNAAGSYLKGVGYTTSYQTTLDGLNTEWTMTGDLYTSVRLKVGSSQYISSDATTSGSSFYCDKRVTDANGVFKLTDNNFVTINYQDAAGATLKESRFESGVTIGATYTATEADMATFTTGEGVTYYYDASSNNSTVIAAGSNSITLKFMGEPGISISKNILGFLSSLTASFTVSGVNLNDDIVLTAPDGVTLSTYSVAKDAVNVTVTVTAASSPVTGNITLTSGGLTKTVVCKSAPKVGVWYNLIQLISNLPVGYIATGADAPGPGLITTDVDAASQYFSFIPVDGKPDTYNIQNAEGNYLANEGGWKSFFKPALDASNTEWTISGDPYNTIRLKIASKGYLASNNIVSNSSLYCDKAIDNANGAFKLVEAPSAILTNGTIGAFATQVGTPVMATITVAGSALQGDIALALSGTNADQFAVSTATLTPTDGAVALTTVTVTYNPTEAATNHVATLTISSTGATSKTFDLSASSSGTGVDNLSSAIKFNVFNNRLAVTGVNNYAVYNVQGMKVADVKVNNANTYVDLKSGIYLVKASNYVQKIIVK
jgi:hypothetical protein